MVFDWDDTSEFFNDEWQVPVTISAVVYNAIPYNKTYGKSIVNAGLSTDIVMSYMFKVEDFTTLPTTDSLVTISGTEYRIKNPVRLDSTGKTFTIDLVDKYG